MRDFVRRWRYTLMLAALLVVISVVGWVWVARAQAACDGTLVRGVIWWECV